MSVHGQRGQALPLGLAMILFGVLGAFALYNVGQAATDKMRLANAADAAAYSGALWQARALNFQAYTNRASVANEVSIAQVVSLRSWAAYGSTTSRLIGVVLGPVPVIGPAAQAVANTMEAVERVVAPIAAGGVRFIDLVNVGISKSQEAMFASTFLATPEIIRDVVGGSGGGDDRFSVNTAYSLVGVRDNLRGWSGFTERTDPDDGLEGMRGRVGMIERSRDRFTRERDWEFFNFWFPTFGPFFRQKVFRRGETRLIAVEGRDGPAWEWKAKDTVSLHTKIWRPWSGTERSETPIGWAEAYANAGGVTIERGCGVLTSALTGASRLDPRCGNWTRNEKAERNARRNVRVPGGVPTSVGIGGYRGPKAFRALSDAVKGEQSTRPALKLKVEVMMPLDRARTTEGLVSGETFATELVAPGERFSSIGIAEIYYQKPPARTDGRMPRERANSYNPYWDVRLSPVSAEERLFALALRPGGTSAGAPALAGTLELGTEEREPSSPGAVGPTFVDSSNALAGGGATRLGSYGRNDRERAEIGEPTAFAHGLADDLEGAAREVMDEFVPARYRTAEGIAGALEDEVGEYLENAVEALLAGLAAELGAGIEPTAERVRDWGQGVLGGAAAGTEGLVDDALGEAERLGRAMEAELEAARPRIASDFTEALASSRTMAEERIAIAGDHIDELGLRLAESGVDREQIESEIEAQEQQIVDAGVALGDELAERLVDIVEEHAGTFPVSLEIAREYVEGVLADPDAPLGDALALAFDEDAPEEDEPDEDELEEEEATDDE